MKRKEQMKEKKVKTRTPAQVKELKFTVVFVSVAILLMLGIFAYTYFKWNSKFDYAKSADETLFTYDGGKVKLRDVTYYILIEEESVNQIAINYDSKDEKSYWNLYVDNTFVSDEAKQAALNYCIRDVLYAEVATEMGMTLTVTEEHEIEKKAQNIVEGLTDKQKELGITGEDIYKALVNNKLADKYVLDLAEQNDLTMKEAVLPAYYGINSKFLKSLKEEMNYQLDEDLWSEVRLGELTIN